MKKGKRFLSAIMAMALLMGLWTMPTVAEENQDAKETVGTLETLVPGEWIEKTLQEDECAYYTFTPEKSGDYYFVGDDYNEECRIFIGSDEVVQASERVWRSISEERGAVCYEYSLTAGVEYTLEVSHNLLAEYTVTFCVMECAPVETMEIYQFGDHEAISEFSIRAGGVGGKLEAECSPGLASNRVTWTSSDETVLKVSAERANTVELTGVSAGTAVVTATAESGVSASCTVTVKDAATVQAGESVEGKMPGSSVTNFSFTPEVSGEYVLHKEGTLWNTRMFDLSLSGEGAVEVESWTEEAMWDWHYKYKLNAGTTYTISVTDAMDMPASMNISYYFIIEEVPHDPVLTEVKAKEATYTEAGNKAYYVCSVCGRLYEDAEGTNQINAEDVIIPQLIKAEENKAIVTTDAVDKALADAAAGGAVIIPAAGAGENVTAADIPLSSLKQVAEKNIPLTVELDGANVVLDAAALASIAKQADIPVVTLKIEQIKEENLSDAQKAAIKDQNVVGAISASIKGIDKEIHTFDGGKVTVYIPFVPAEGTEAKDYSILYVADDGTTEVMPVAYENGYLVMTTDHLSEYVIVYNAPKVEENNSSNTNQEESSNTNKEESSNTVQEESSTVNTEESSDSDKIEQTSKPESDSPQTGDTAQIGMVICIAGMAVIVLLAAVKAKKKYN